MAKARKGARLLERIWFFMESQGEGRSMRTDMIHQHYRNTYGDAPRLSNMTQSLLRSGLFNRVGWFDRNTNEMVSSTKSSVQLGISASQWVCVVEAKPIDEIVSNFVNGKRSLRAINNMPSFVRQAVSLYEGEE